MAQRCRFRTAKCHHCGKTGHIKAACRSAQQKTQRTQHHASTVKTLEFVPDLGEYELNYAGGGGVRPIKVDLEVDGQQLSMEVDTGASLSLVSDNLQETVAMQTSTTHDCSVEDILRRTTTSVGYSSSPRESW